MAETGSDTRSGIGARLRAGRERMGLTQLQTAEKLHLDPKVIEALEAERFDALGAPVFVRGHLKHYAELINEQTAELLDLYTSSTKPAQPDLTRLPKAAPDSSPSRLAVPALLVLIVFVLIGVVWWVLQSMHKSSGTAPTAHEVSTEPEIIPPAADGPVGEGAPSGTQPVALPGSANAPTKSLQIAATEPASSTPPALAPAPSAAGKPMEVTLRFSADSWVEVYDANGQKLFYDVGSAESQRTVSGTPPLRVTFANAPGVSLDVNGKPATVPANAMHEDAAEFVINRSGRIVRARPRAGPAQTEGR